METSAMGQNKRAEIKLADRILSYDRLYEKSILTHKQRELDLIGLGNIRNKLILDVGCGAGGFSILLAMKDNAVVGIDLSYNALNTAKSKSQEKRVIFLPVVCDVEALPFKNKCFDICFCGGVFHHFSNITKMVREIHGVEKKGGILAAVENNGSNVIVRLSRVVVAKICGGRIMREAGGTENVTIHTHKHYHKILSKCGFSDFKIVSCYHGIPFGKKQLMPRKNLDKSVFIISNTIYTIIIYLMNKLLPQPYSGPILLLSCRKP